MKPHSITVLDYRRFNDDPIYDLHVDGHFVSGSISRVYLANIEKSLEANAWNFLRLYGTAADPLELIACVRDLGCSFDGQSKIETGSDGRTIFSGNFREYSAAFSYLLLDAALIARVCQAAPEILVSTSQSATRPFNLSLIHI